MIVCLSLRFQGAVDARRSVAERLLTKEKLSLMVYPGNNKTRKNSLNSITVCLSKYLELTSALVFVLIVDV